MSDTDILLTLYSIVAGLGISKLVQGLATMIEARARIRFYWVHSAWLVIIAGRPRRDDVRADPVREEPALDGVQLHAGLCMPLLLYLVSDLIVPAVGEDESVDLRAYLLPQPQVVLRPADRA